MRVYSYNHTCPGADEYAMNNISGYGTIWEVRGNSVKLIDYNVQPDIIEKRIERQQNRQAKNRISR